MDPDTRQRVAQLLVSHAGRTRIAQARARAVVELAARPGVSWADLATQLGVSVSAINRMITMGKKSLAARQAATGTPPGERVAARMRRYTAGHEEHR